MRLNSFSSVRLKPMRKQVNDMERTEAAAVEQELDFEVVTLNEQLASVNRC